MSEVPSDVVLSWVVPMFRTSAFVEELCERIAAASRAAALRSEILLVDDSCPEESAARAERVTVSCPLRVVRLDTNQGQDAAVRAGLRLCRGRYAVVLDADLQDPPEALAALWPLAEQGFDAVFADRFGPYEGRGRLMTSRLYRWSARAAGGLPRGAGLFVLMNRGVIDAVAATRKPRVSILAAIAATGGRYASVRVERTPRRDGRSAYGAAARGSKALRSLWQIFAARRLGLRL